MKFVSKLVVFVALFALVSCSNDDNPDPVTDPNASDVFNYTYEGNAQAVTSIEASKSETTLAVVGKMDNGQRIEILFNSFGDLGYVSSYSVQNVNFLDTKSHFRFSSNFFNFNLISIDESTKRVKVEFSGKLYTDEDSISSTFVTISGNFDVKYTDINPSISGLDVSAKIAGIDWHSTKSNESTFSTQNFYSDDQYAISIRFSSAVTTGNYTFDNLSTTNYVYLSKYTSTATGGYYEQYSANGSVNLTSKTAYSIGYIYEGTYSFTATNPSNSSNTIQVTNGKFKYFDF